MTSPMAQQEEPTLGELALEDMSQQLAATARQLAVVRQQFNQLSRFVEQNSEKLGLTQESPNPVEASQGKTSPDESPTEVK